MKKFIFILLVSGIVFGMALPSFCADKGETLIIDVRTQAEWNNGHLEGAILIPYDVIAEKIRSIVKEKHRKIYVYCRSGRRSQIAKESLEKLGYRDVVNLGSLEEAGKTMKRKIVR